MYRETYEDYIRSILGYPNQNTYQNSVEHTNYRNDGTERMLETCYPEIYKVVYPMVNKACMTNTRPVTSELIDELTNEIYSSLETDNNGINLTINLSNEVQTGNTNNRQESTTRKPAQNRGEDRQFRNRGLQDLIRILLIRELLGRPSGFNRPPRPQHRPPMPPFPGVRPPMMPRYGNEFQDIYE